MGKLNFRLGRQLESYQKEYSPPTRVRPLPFSVIQDLDTVAQVTTSRNIALSNITWVAYFFLLWPGEYCKGGTKTAQHPFRINNVKFSIGQNPYNAATESNAVLAQPTWSAS